MSACNGAAGNAEHLYYRWRVHSLSQGDTLGSWRTTPFQQVVGGPIWIPPPKPNAETNEQTTETHQQIHSHTDVVQSAPIPAPSASAESERIDLVVDELQTLLRAVTLESDSIWSVSSFAVANAEFATDIVSLIVESCCVDQTPIPRKLARLYCLSDILHLSGQVRGVRNVSAYRTLIEAGMSAVCMSWHSAFQRGLQDASTLPTDTLVVGAGPVARRYVLEVLETWKSWSAYPEQTIQTWMNFLNQQSSSDK